MSVIKELERPETRLAVQALCELRPPWSSSSDLVSYVDEVFRPQGYRLAAGFENEIEQAIAVAGFRVANALSVGKYLYLDDLSTVPAARRRGHATALLTWIVGEARRLGCGQVHLDSGPGPARAAAHRAYLNTGFQITALHFAASVE